MVKVLTWLLVYWLVLASPVLAENWVQVVVNDNGTTYVDSESIQSTDQGHLKVWQLLVLTPQGRQDLRNYLIQSGSLSPSAPIVFSTKDQVEFTPDRQMRGLYTVFYGEGDKVLGHGPAQRPFSPVIPGTAQEEIWSTLYADMLDGKYTIKQSK
jgi:hypothetical protein